MIRHNGSFPSATSLDHVRAAGGYLLCPPLSMSTPLDDLEAALADPRKPVLVVIGAGVSIASTNANPYSSWVGLLRDGVRFCSNYVPDLPTGWAERVTAQLDRGDLVEMLGVAQQISGRLGYPNGGDYQRWLSETVGSLKATDRRLLQSIAALNAQIATTNYDELAEQATGKKSVTWQDSALAIQFLRADLDDVLHLHGLWSKPASVILGLDSYSRILADPTMQGLLRGFLMYRTVLFIGCGAGLADPNFASLLDWSREALAISPYHHYRLVSRCELPDIRRQHQPGDRVLLLAYGDTHEELVPFLEAMADRLRQKTGPPATPAQQLALRQSEFQRRLAELNVTRPTLAPGAYLRQLFAMTAELSATGGSAVLGTCC